MLCAVSTLELHTVRLFDCLVQFYNKTWLKQNVTIRGQVSMNLALSNLSFRHVDIIDISSYIVYGPRGDTIPCKHRGRFLCTTGLNKCHALTGEPVNALNRQQRNMLWNVNTQSEVNRTTSTIPVLFQCGNLPCIYPFNVPRRLAFDTVKSDLVPSAIQQCSFYVLVKVYGPSFVFRGTEICGHSKTFYSVHSMLPKCTENASSDWSNVCAIFKLLIRRGSIIVRLKKPQGNR